MKKKNKADKQNLNNNIENVENIEKVENAETAENAKNVDEILADQTPQSNGGDTVTDAKVSNADDPVKDTTMEVKFGLKSFLTICGILLAVMIVVGILTYVIPAGTYDVDAEGQIIADSYHLKDDANPLPVWRWFTAPFEAIVRGSGNFTTI
ncbi:MAG: hypothetical protein K2M64_00255, partial [Clostridia bacterium]|nr:hypothetical protein [Clostridia bacterium]